MANVIRVSRQFATMTKPEREALLAVWRRDFPTMSLRQGWRAYRRFRKLAFYSFINGCWMVPWRGMWLGIENDGHTHT